VRPRTALLALACALLAPAVARASEAGARTRYVTIYDSHGLTAFGDRLDAWLLARPRADLTSYTLGGASPEWLLRQLVSPRGYLFQSGGAEPLLLRSKLPQRKLAAPALDDLLRVPEGRYDRQIVILTLGSNVPGRPGDQAPRVEKIVRSINARPDAICVWIGPPAMRAWSAGYAEKVYQSLRDGIRAAEDGAPAHRPACHLVDSRPISDYPSDGDGMHYGFTSAGVAAAHHWADSVAAAIERVAGSAAKATASR
jgi:hypothetical protein